jgi:hypothetical protein
VRRLIIIMKLPFQRPEVSVTPCCSAYVYSYTRPVLTINTETTCDMHSLC